MYEILSLPYLCLERKYICTVMLKCAHGIYAVGGISITFYFKTKKTKS
jgi:hypothetical protein